MKKLIIAITLLLTSLAFAEHETTTKPPVKKFNFWWEQVPAVCSTSDEIERPDQACIVFRTFDMKLNTDLLNKKDI